MPLLGYGESSKFSSAVARIRRMMTIGWTKKRGKYRKEIKEREK
jgi:hypothetical protein